MSASKGKIKRVSEIINLLEKEKEYPFHLCGNWIEKLDNSYSQDFSEKPKLISVPHVSGLSDRFVGIATVFLLSLITNRLFQLGNIPELLPLESAYSPRFPQITHNMFDSQMISLMRENKINRRATIIEYNSSNHPLIINAIGDGEFLLLDSTISRMGDFNTTDVYVVSNRGRTIAMFDQPFLKKKLTKLGLKKSTAFGCALRYLFKPRPETFLPILPTLETLVEPNILKIAIHIRTHDGVLVYGNKIHFPNYFPYFTCAEQIEKFNPSSKVKWLLFTDSIELREQALKYYGNKLQTTLDVPVEHSAKEMVCPGQTCVSNEGFQLSAAEWWSLGLADYHVVGIQGGYGKTASMRAGRLNSTYLIYPDQTSEEINCSRKKYARVSELKVAYAGV